jgi:16S rRNA (guanine(966)-N(2))-methyltransferase RsmD
MRVISGRVGGRRIESPPGQSLRPMMDKVRAALFDMLWHLNAVQGRALDLYAGSGAVGIEALSRGSRFVDFVEMNPVSARTIQHNLDQLGLTAEGRVHKRKVEDVLANPKVLGHHGAYDLITVTPPYPATKYDEMVAQIAGSPLVGEGTVVVVEHPRESQLEDEIGPLVRLRERKYGRTILSIYHVPGGEQGYDPADEPGEEDAPWPEEIVEREDDAE